MAKAAKYNPDVKPGVSQSHYIRDMDAIGARYSQDVPSLAGYFLMNGKRSRKRMAKVTRNMIVSGLSGSLGRDHYARTTRDGRTIISLKPDFSNRQFSEAQLNRQKLMKSATAYAKVAAKENPVYARLAEGTAKNAYNIALADWMNPPVIRSIDLRHNNTIRVGAMDDIQVLKVLITILDEQGQLL